MSVVLNLLCPICTDIFRNVDDIQSTSCGHVFHSQCMLEWKNRSNSCPKCRTYNPATYKLYLSFDETVDTVKELKEKLDKSAEEINKMQINISLGETEIAELKDQILASDDLKHTNANLEECNLKQSRKILSLNQEILDLRESSEAIVNALKTEYKINTSVREAEIAELKDQILASDGLKQTNADLEKCNFNQSRQILSLSQEILALKTKNKKYISNRETEIELKDQILASDDLNKTNSNMEECSFEEILDLKDSSETIVNALKTENIENKLKLEVSKNHELSEELTRFKATNTSSDSKAMSELKEEIALLKKDLDKTSVELEKEISKNSQLTIECIHLKAMNSSKDCSKKNIEIMEYDEKMKALEHRLKHVSKEFEKEITKSTQLEIEKIKLQSYIDRMKSNPSTTWNMELNDQIFVKTGVLRNPSIASSTDSLNSRSDSNLRERRNAKGVLKARNSSNQSSDFLNTPQIRHFEDSTSNSIIIQSYPSDKLAYPLENIVILLAAHMNILLNKSEISKVNIVGRNSRNLGERVSLFVRFKHRDKKTKFLANENRLRTSSTIYLRSIQIKEYLDDRVNEVFLYARAKLPANGFNDIFWTNNQIFAKKNVSDSKGIRIYSRQQVDEILKNPSASGEEAYMILNSTYN